MGYVRLAYFTLVQGVRRALLASCSAWMSRVQIQPEELAALLLPLGRELRDLLLDGPLGLR